MEFTEVVKERYSCKKFDGRQITPAQLDAILQAGRLAPTAKNLQEQHIYVVQSAAGLEKIDDITPCRYGAPTVLVVAFDKKMFLSTRARTATPASRMRPSWPRT